MISRNIDYDCCDHCNDAQNTNAPYHPKFNIHNIYLINYFNVLYCATCVTLSNVDGVDGAKEVAGGEVMLAVTSVVAHIN